jgi:hypothetical protein
MVTGMIGFAIPSEFLVYIEDPQIVAIIFAFADLILRIIGFIVLYPIIKFFITIIVFRPIWKHGIKKSLLKKQNEKALAKFEESPRGKKRFVPSKKLNKSFLGRFWGAFMGGVRGFVMAFVFLLPILVIAGFLADVPDVVTLRVFSNETTLSTGDSTELVTLPPIVEEYLAQIKEMNQSGLGAITSQIIINGKPIDRLIFDMIFTTQVIVEGEEPVDINFVQEVGNVVGIAKILLDGGYLEDGFDFTTISKDNLGDIEAIFTFLGQSDLIGFVVPFGTKYAVNNLLPDMINGINLYDRQYSAAALNQFTSISWSEEFANFYGIIEAVLEFGSVSELMTYASNPELLAELTPEEGVKLANIVRAVGELQFYALVSAGADLATVLPQVQSMITWLDPSEVEEYLQRRLAFIIQNPNFFRGEDGEIARLAELVEFMFEDEDLLTQILAATQEGATPEQIIEAVNGEWVGSLLQRVVDLELLMNLIPFGVDYGLYTASGNLIEAEVADQIAQRLEDVSWEAEILNIGDIYAEVFKLGIAALLGTDPDYVAFADDVLVNHMTEIRAIVQKIFEESEVVNAAIEIASPIIVDRFIQDDELKSLVNDALISDPTSGVVDFSFGQEINNILTMIESVYTFTSISELMSVGEMTPEQQLDLMSRFGSMTSVQYGQFTGAIESLQILQRVGEAGLEYVRNSQGIEQLYVPSGVQLGEEITSIIGIAYYAAKYVYDNRLIYDSFEEIDFAPLFADEEFRSHFLKTDDNNHSNLLLTNIAHNIKLYSTDPSIGEYLGVPQSLFNAPNESDLWMTEINALLGAVLDFVASFEDSSALTLSARGVLPIVEDPMSAKVLLFTQYANLAQAQLAFGSLDSSKIFRMSIVKAANSFGSVTESILNGYTLGIPQMAKENEMLLQGTFVELIHGLATLAEDMNGSLGFVTAGDAMNGASLGALLNAYNQVSDETLETFAEIKLIRGVFSELILSPLVQEYVRSLVGGTGIVQVSDTFFGFTRVDQEISVEDFQELFIALRGLGVTETLINDPMGQVFVYLQTLTDEKLADIFDGTIIKELFTFTLTDPVLLNSVADLVSAAYEGVQSSVAQLGQVNPNFLAIVSGLGTYTDVYGLFDTNEIKAFIRAFNRMNIDSMEELNSLGDLTVIHQKLNDQPVIATLFESNWLYDNVNYVFTNTDLQDQLASILEEQALSQAGVTVDITRDAVSFSLPKYGLIETDGPRNGGIKVSEINRFILSATRVNWLGVDLGAGIAIASNASGILMSTGSDSVLNIDYILESKLLMAIFDKVLNFEHNGLNLDEIAIGYANNLLSGISLFAGVSLSKELLHYDVRALDANLVLRKEEIKEIVEALSMIDLSGTIGINTFYQLTQDGTFEEIFDSYIIHSLISNIFTDPSAQNALATVATTQLQSLTGTTETLENDDLSLVLPKYEILETAGTRSGMVKVLELKNLVIAAGRLDWATLPLGSGAAAVTNISSILLETGTDGERHIDVILESRFVMALLDKVLNFEYNGIGMDAIAISYVNNAAAGFLEGTVLQKEILHYDTRAYDANQVIKKSEIAELVEALSYIDLNMAIGLPTFYQMIDDGTFDEIFDSYIIHSLISNVLTSTDIHTFGVNKINGLQSIVVLDSSFLAIDPILMDGDLFKQEEFENIFIALRALGLSDSASFSSIGLSTFSELQGRNIDVGTGKDDFDRVFDANFMYIILDRALKLSSLGDYVGTTLGNALGVTINSFDTTPPQAMLGKAGDPEVEVGRIPKAEFRRLFVSFGLLGDVSSIGLSTFLNLIDTSIDPLTEDDDFKTFIASDFIYVILGRLLNVTEFGDYVGELLSGAFGDDTIALDMTPPSDAKGQVAGDIEEGLMTRFELRQLMVSFKMLGLENGTDIDISTILGMVGANEDINGDDDFDRFLTSLYIQDKISILLLADPIIELIANGRFLPEDFVLPAGATVNVDGRDRMTKQEIYNLFNGLIILGLSDLEGANLGLDTITALDDAEITEVLESSYLYVVIDLMLKSETQLVLPPDAFEAGGIYDGMVKKSEILSVLNAFEILGSSNPGDIDPNNISLDDIVALLDLNSAIIDQLLSDAIVEALTGNPLNSINTDIQLNQGSGASTKLAVITEVPAEALNLAGTRLLRSEMYALIEALRALDINDLNADIDVDTVTLDQLKEVHYLGLGIDPMGDVYESYLLHRLLSEAIAGAVTVPSAAMMNAVDLYPDEISALIAALEVMNLSSLSDPIDVDNITLAQLQAIHYLGLGTDPMGDLYESYTIHRLISTSVIGAVTVPDDAYMVGSTEDVNPNEISALIAALEAMGLSTLSDPIDVNTITVNQLRSIHYLGLGIDPMGDVYESLIIHRLISEAVIGAVTVPDDAMMGLEDVKPLEISALIEALAEMGLATLGDPIDVNTITIAQLRNIHYLGLGIDPVDDQYESLIIHRLISEAVIGAVTVPDDAMMGLDDVKPLEISALIEALAEMGLSTLGDPIDVNTITLTQLQNIHYLGLGIDPVDDQYESLIIHRLISEAVIGAVEVPDDAMMGALDVKPLEISALILALGEMGLTTLGDPIDVNTITLTQLRNIHYLGLGIDPVDDQYESLIIHRLISEAVIDAVEVPDDAMMGALDVKPLEISALIEALGEMGLATLGDPIDVNTITLTQLQNIHYLGLGIDPVDDKYESLIIHRLISEAVIGAVEVPDDAMMGALDVEPLEISALILALGEMGLATLGDPIDVNIITLTQLQNIHYLGLGIDPAGDEYESLIIHRLISEAVIGAVVVPDDAYMVGSTEDVKPNEISALILALEEMGLATLGDPIDVNIITLTQLQNIHYLGLGIDPAGDEYESLIIHRLISEAVIGAVDVPDDAYMVGSTEDVKPLEISALILALEEMGLGTLGDPIDVAGIQIAQLQAIHYLGLGTDPMGDDYESLIIHRLISDAITGSLDTPSGAYMVGSTVDLLAAEVQGVIDALLLLAGGNDTETMSGLTPVNNNVLTPGLIEDLLDLDALIIYRLIGSGIISATLATDESLAEVGDDNYDANNIGADVKISEMYALVEAMNIMGIANLSVSIDATTVTISDLQELHYVGLGIDPGTDTYQSRIVHRILSDAIISALDIPSTAYMLGSSDDLLAVEIQGVIDAMLQLGASTDTLTNLTPIDNNALTSTVLQNLIDINTRIVDRLIADGIIASGKATTESYAVFGDVNYDPTAINEDIKRAEMQGVVDGMDILGIASVLDLGTISIASVLAMSDEDADLLFDNTNTIIYYIVDELVQAQPLLMAQLDPSDFEAFAPFRIKRASLITLIKNNN